ncbi:MAG TPA: STAS domain-containing protein [Puia sp.]|jgi:anti-anti-sigma factor|nr:STAS domain-containing protein [Puia sp.]
MRFKIDTREKFHAITIQESTLAANMTAEIDECLLVLLQNGVKNAILILKDIQNIDNAAAEVLVKIQQIFNENKASFVICELSKQVEKSLDEEGLLELLNITRTESEAKDMVQMEVLERELLDGEAPS